MIEILIQLALAVFMSLACTAFTHFYEFVIMNIPPFTIWGEFLFRNRGNSFLKPLGACMRCFNFWLGVGITTAVMANYPDNWWLLVAPVMGQFWYYFANPE